MTTISLKIEIEQPITMNTANQIMSSDDANHCANETPAAGIALATRITAHIEKYDWQMISGGEHDGKWINPKYPKEIFDSGSIPDPRQAGGALFFPLTHTEEDPHGIGLSLEVGGGGTYFRIVDNHWHEVTGCRSATRRKKRAVPRSRARSNEHGEEDLDHDIEVWR